MRKATAHASAWIEHVAAQLEGNVELAVLLSGLAFPPQPGFPLNSAPNRITGGLRRVSESRPSFIALPFEA